MIGCVEVRVRLTMHWGKGLHLDYYMGTVG